MPMIRDKTIRLPARWRMHCQHAWGRWTVALLRRPDPSCACCYGLGSVQVGPDPEDGESCPECWTPQLTLWPVGIRRRSTGREVPF